MGKSPPPFQAAADPKAVLTGFAGLNAKLDYLNASDVEQVRQAYRFADEAHLGQLRGSGAP